VRLAELTAQVLSKERVVKMKQVEHTNSEREMLERVRHPMLVNLWFVSPLPIALTPQGHVQRRAQPLHGHGLC